MQFHISNSTFIEFTDDEVRQMVGDYLHKKKIKRPKGELQIHARVELEYVDEWIIGGDDEEAKP